MFQIDIDYCQVWGYVLASYKLDKNAMAQQHLDVLIIGAGISGIGLGVHLTLKSPQKKFAILERRETIGGTWDLFRYPGIRSDSDMSTFGYEFKPWTDSKVLADGTSIRNYVNETAKEYKIFYHIHFQRQVKSANWSSAKKLWQLEVYNIVDDKTEQWTADFLLGCTGYYNYDQGFKPSFPQEDQFKGQVIHPQHWPEDLDYSDKKVVIIGSGATAITLVPAMAATAAHVTMLQRSPTYIAAVPSIDKLYVKMKKMMPEKVAYSLTRMRNIGLQRIIYKLSLEKPELVKKLLLKNVRMRIGKDVDMKHFTPSYNPWDQRLCAVPDGDLFKVIKKGKASIETDQIDHFTENGILLKSGKHLDADIIVSATGLNIQILGGVQATIDGTPIATCDHMLYKGILLSNVPNAAIIIGYTNASWTLKVDVAADYLSRLFNYMDKKNYKVVVPKADADELTSDAIMGSLSSGYIQRAVDVMPRQGKSEVWRVSMNYIKDRSDLRKSGFEDNILSFDSGKVKSKKRFKLFG